MLSNDVLNTRLSNLKGIIWDLDNTLYRADEAIELAFNMAMARAAIDAGAPLEFNEAVKMSRKSFDDCGYSGRVFVERYGISRDHLHYISHGFIDEKVIEASLEAQDLFRGLDLQHTLITHSSEVWAHKVLDHLGLRPFFQDSNILGFEHYNYERKSETPRAFELALARKNLPARDIMMVEDLIPNLRIPHELGMTTVLLHHGQKPREIPHWVDYCCNNMLDILRLVKDVTTEKAEFLKSSQSLS